MNKLIDNHGKHICEEHLFDIYRDYRRDRAVMICRSCGADVPEDWMDRT